MEGTHIEWTATYLLEPVLWKGELTTIIPGNTFNIVIGCEKVSPACKNCYAESRDKRLAGGKHWGPNSERQVMSENYWKQPLKWQKEAAAAGINVKVFCSSLADWAEVHPTVAEQRIRLFKLIEDTPNLTWLLLTKRIEKVLEMLPGRWFDGALQYEDGHVEVYGNYQGPKNIWFGTTVESQEYAEKRVWELLRVKKRTGRVAFLSIEPQLGPVDLENIDSRGPCSLNALSGEMVCGKLGYNGQKLDWVICGGESGNKARPMSPAWARSLRDQCAKTKTPFFFKQWGEYKYFDYFPIPLEDLTKIECYWENDAFVQRDSTTPAEKIRSFPIACKVGKHNSGRLLDGKLYNEMPA